MKLDRRGFLLGLGSASVGAFVPLNAISLAGGAESIGERGISVPIAFRHGGGYGGMPFGDIQRIIEKVLVPHAEKNLPSFMRYEIRASMPTYYGRHGGMAWYHHPSMVEDETWEDHPFTGRFGYGDRGWVGYFQLARCTTPA